MRRQLASVLLSILFLITPLFVILLAPIGTVQAESGIITQLPPEGVVPYAIDWQYVDRTVTENGQVATCTIPSDNKIIFGFPSLGDALPTGAVGTDLKIQVKGYDSSGTQRCFMSASWDLGVTWTTRDIQYFPMNNSWLADGDGTLGHSTWTVAELNILEVKVWAPDDPAYRCCIDVVRVELTWELGGGGTGDGTGTGGQISEHALLSWLVVIIFFLMALAVLVFARPFSLPVRVVLFMILIVLGVIFSGWVHI